MNINVFDIFHGGVYYVDDEKAPAAYASMGFGGYVRFDALTSGKSANFIPIYKDGCWGGMGYDDQKHWDENCRIEAAPITDSAVLDMLDYNGGWDFSSWEHGEGPAVLSDKEQQNSRYIRLRYIKEGKFHVKFVEHPDLFDTDKELTHMYTIQYLHELQRLMIVHGWGKKAMEIGIPCED